MQAEASAEAAAAPASLLDTALGTICSHDLGDPAVAKKMCSLLSEIAHLHKTQGKRLRFRHKNKISGVFVTVPSCVNAEAFSKAERRSKWIGSAIKVSCEGGLEKAAAVDLTSKSL